MPELAQIFVTRTTGNWYNRFFAQTISWATAVKTPVKRSWKTLGRSYRWVKSSVNHAGGYIGKGRIVQASRTVEIASTAEYPQATWVELPGPLKPSADQEQLIINFWLTQVGKKYNWLDIIAIGLAQKRFGRLLPVISRSWWEKRLSNGNHFICSQLIDAGYLAAGIHLFTDGRPDGLVSPEDLKELGQ